MSHIIDIFISYFDSFSNILTDVFHSAGIAISINRHFFSFVFDQGHGNDVWPVGFDLLIGMSWNVPEESWIVHVSCTFFVAVSGV